MKIDVELAYVHTPHFHVGKNFTERLCTNEYRGLNLVYDTDVKELLVTWNNRVAHIPESNVRAYFPLEVGTKELAKESKNNMPKINPNPVKAQVSGPQSHVFNGPGAGKR